MRKSLYVCRTDAASQAEVAHVSSNIVCYFFNFRIQGGLSLQMQNPRLWKAVCTFCFSSCSFLSLVSEVLKQPFSLVSLLRLAEVNGLASI